MSRVERFDDLAAEALRRPARLGPVRLVAVDGGAGSGKTTFAGRLASAFTRAGASVEVVATDALLEGWADQFGFWPRLERAVLTPLRHGDPGSCPVYDWHSGRFGPVVPVPVPDVLILEGVSAAREQVAGELTLSVLLVADPDLRLARAVARDGPAIDVELRRWLAAEPPWYVRDRTAARVDRIVDGAPMLRHDPESAFVTIGEAD